MEKQNTQELRSVSDGQKNTLDKDQSKMIDAELVGLLVSLNMGHHKKIL